MTHLLTARYLDTLPPQATRYEVFDEQVPALAVRVTPAGHKSWTLFYRHNGRLRRLTLGRYPDLGLADARKAATRERGRIVDGADPAAERQDERATYGDTVGALFDLYRSKTEKRKSWPEQRRIFENEVLPSWRHRRVADITRRDIRELIDRKATSAPIMANRMLARVSRLFSFAVEHDWIEANPALRIAKPSEEKSRDRVLTRDELRVLWPALHETEATGEDGQALPRLPATLNAAFVVMLLTAQRMGEVCRMRWDDVDLDRGWWTIPAVDSKNDDPHRVPLTPSVVTVIRARKNDREDRYVFSTHGHAPVADRAKKAAAMLSRGLTFTFRAHDLRRTAASYMAEAGVDRMHIAHVLNHRSVTRSTVTAIYDRYNYDKEKRAALEIWARELDGIVKNQAGLALVRKTRGVRSGGTASSRS
jgi:integrase